LLTTLLTAPFYHFLVAIVIMAAFHHFLVAIVIMAAFHHFLVAIVIMAAVISGKFLTITSVISAVQSLASKRGSF
jgi:hypothetical protein